MAIGVGMASYSFALAMGRRFRVLIRREARREAQPEARPVEARRAQQAAVRGAAQLEARGRAAAADRVEAEILFAMMAA